MTKTFLQEIFDMHRYLEDWLKGAIPKGNGEPARLIKALADDFLVIHPNGSIAEKQGVISSFASAYGEKPAAYELKIDMVRTRMIQRNVCLATYQEEHIGESGRRRLSSAVLHRRETDRAMEWLFLQETFSSGVRSIEAQD